MKKIIVLLLVINQLAFAQSVKVSAFKQKVVNELFTNNEDTITYPVISAASAAVSKKINAQISATFIDSVYINQPFNIGLDSAISHGLINMSYEVTYNQNNVLSLTIDAEGCGAYCTEWNTYFNFDLTNGKAIALSDILKENKKEPFTKLVFNKKKEELAAYKEDLAESLKKKEIDLETYNWALEEVNSNCIKSISLSQFSISATELVVADNCPFPHVIRFIEPTYKLNYTYAELKEFLKPEWQTILNK